MLNRIFPKQADNAAYRGWRAAIWLMVPILLLRTVQGVNSIIDTSDVATNADGIPLDTYGAAGRETVIALFALAGISYLLLAALGLVVLIRYRALLAFLYLLLLLDVAVAKVIVALHPIVRSGAATIGPFSVGALINDTILAVLVLGFALSLLTRRAAP